MKVKVCDALCGAGKTQSCITMINNSKDERFIFITPYLTEVERIKTCCSSKGFVSPEKTVKSQWSKHNDINRLLREKRNIASTHALFADSTDETKELLKEGGYTLILDEVIDLFQPTDLDGEEIKFLLRHNAVSKDGDNVVWQDDEYKGLLFKDLRKISESKNLVDYDGEFFFWKIPIEVFKCFKDAYVLTYLFEYQLQKYYFTANGIEYELIGTKKENGVYHYCPLEEMDRKIELRDKIHIIFDDKFNGIGQGRYSLSKGWFDRAVAEEGQPKLHTLKNNLYNIFRRYKGESTYRMWSCLNPYRRYLKGKGYSNGFVPFNKRATNDYVNCRYLAYCVNVFLRPWEKNYLKRIGAGEVNQDMYALSVLIQWVFRSAVRSGEEVWLYIPSQRMRILLYEWLNNLANGTDLEPIEYDKCSAAYKKDTRLSLTAKLKKNNKKLKETENNGERN